MKEFSFSSHSPWVFKSRLESFPFSIPLSKGGQSSEARSALASAILEIRPDVADFEMPPNVGLVSCVGFCRSVVDADEVLVVEVAAADLRVEAVAALKVAMPL